MLRALNNHGNTPGPLAVLHQRFAIRRSDFPGHGREWAADLLAGVTVAVVALPLALGFGIASGVGALPGLITAIVAGVVAAVFGGSNVQVSGPTGAMTVVLLPMVAAHGARVVPLLAVLAGGMVLLGGILGLGRAVELLPRPVVEGFTVGIAAVIFLQQVPILLHESGRSSSHNTMRLAIAALAAIDWQHVVPALIIGGGTIAVTALVLRIRATLPGALLAVVLSTCATWYLGLDVPTIGSISVRNLSVGIDRSLWGDTPNLLSAALVIALLAAIESLLSARVADGLTDTSPTDPDRELVGQGFANIASGLLGGLPATGAIARTAVNVRAGAHTRIAAVSHGLVLAVLLLVAQPLVAHIPVPALAGVLMFTAVRMVERATVRSVLGSGRADVLVFVATAATTIAFDLVRAVEVGVVVAAIIALRASARASGLAPESLEQHEELIDGARTRQLLRDHVVVFRVQGSLFFGAAQRFLDELARIDNARVIVLRLGSVHTVDATGAHALAASIDAFQRRGITVVLCGVQERHRAILAAHDIPGTSFLRSHMFDELGSALTFASQEAAA